MVSYVLEKQGEKIRGKSARLFRKSANAPNILLKFFKCCNFYAKHSLEKQELEKLENMRSFPGNLEIDFYKFRVLRG